MRYFRKMAGERLYLSPVVPDDTDVETYVRWMNDRAIAADFGAYADIVASKNELKWIYETQSDMQRYAIVLSQGDTLIGTISIHNINFVNRSAFIGILIGETVNRGVGYGAEAIKLLLEYGFYTLNLNSILLTVHADNASAIACYQKVGFRQVGCLPEHVYKNGRYVDKLYMAILLKEYALHKSMEEPS